MMKFSVFLVLVCVCSMETLHLPSYIGACVYTDPNFKECVLTNAKRALPSVIKGDDEYKVMKTDPLKIAHLDLFSSDNFQLSFSDLEVKGISKVELKNVEIDADKSYCDANVTFPEIEIAGNYEMDGQVMSLPLKGKGYSKIVLKDVQVRYGFQWTLVDKNGDKYMKIEDAHMSFNENGAHFEFEDLFDGDPTLGPQMNNFLNDNWREITNDINESVGLTIKHVITPIFKGYFEAVPYNEIIL